MRGGILFPLKSIGQLSLQGAPVLLLLVPPVPPWQWDRGGREEEKGHRALGLWLGGTLGLGHLTLGDGARALCSVQGGCSTKGGKDPRGEKIPSG